jgi:hypothetical protein
LRNVRCIRGIGKIGGHQGGEVDALGQRCLDARASRPQRPPAVVTGGDRLGMTIARANWRAV